MAKFNVIKRILDIDFPDKYKDLTAPLLRVLNQFIEQVTLALTNGLTFQDNFNAQVITIDVTAPVSRTSAIKIQSTLKGLCRGVIVTDGQNVTDASGLNTAPFCAFENGPGEVRLTSIAGLESGKRYKLTLVLLG